MGIEVQNVVNISGIEASVSANSLKTQKLNTSGDISQEINVIDIIYSTLTLPAGVAGQLVFDGTDLQFFNTAWINMTNLSQVATNKADIATLQIPPLSYNKTYIAPISTESYFYVKPPSGKIGLEISEINIILGGTFVSGEVISYEIWVTEMIDGNGVYTGTNIGNSATYTTVGTHPLTDNTRWIAPDGSYLKQLNIVIWSTQNDATTVTASLQVIGRSI